MLQNGNFTHEFRRLLLNPEHIILVVGCFLSVGYIIIALWKMDYNVSAGFKVAYFNT